MAIHSFKLDQLLMLLFPLNVTGVIITFRNECRFLNSPNESKFVEQIFSILWHQNMSCPLVTDPPPKRRVLLALEWHDAMTVLLFELDQLLTLLVPQLVVWFEGVGTFLPSKPDFVQQLLLFWSHFLFDVSCSLLANPPPQRRVFFAPFWHRAMAIHSFEFDQLLTLLFPLNMKGVIITFRNECRFKNFPNEFKFVQ
jgi:hypothetical protein